MSEERRVKEERCGWRDEKISRWHRMLGWNLPAIDLDFLLIEYDLGEPRALIEYKHVRAGPQKASHPSYRALILLGDRAHLPVFNVRYQDDFSRWVITPLNEEARVVLFKPKEMTEREFTDFLYELRGRRSPWTEQTDS